MSSTAVSVRLKRAVAERARYCCEYCFSQLRFSPDPFSVEHIIPSSRHGTDDFSNLAFACQGCNNRKYIDIDAIDPVTGETVALYHPRQHIWEEHFRWSDDTIHIIGLSPTGRASVEKLRLNREGVVNLR